MLKGVRGSVRRILSFDVLFRRFPSNLVFWRTTMDCMFALQFIWLNGWQLQGAHGDMACNATISFLTQFSLMASLCWYVLMAVNFYFSISDPFSRPAAKTRIYHVLSWSAASISAFVAALLSGYRPDFKLCWIRNTLGVNLGNWVLYWFPLVVSTILCIVLLMMGLWNLGVCTCRAPKFARQAQASRWTSIKHAGVFTGVFTMYWVACSLLWIWVEKRGICSAA